MHLPLTPYRPQLPLIFLTALLPCPLPGPTSYCALSWEADVICLQRTKLVQRLDKEAREGDGDTQEVFSFIKFNVLCHFLRKSLYTKMEPFFHLLLYVYLL